MQHLAAKGWVCVAINYRLAPRDPFPAQIVDVKKAIAWIRENIAAYGGDPDYIAITGGSAGGHLTALAALTPNDPEWQPGFEDVDTSVQAGDPALRRLRLRRRRPAPKRATLMRDLFLARRVLQTTYADDPEVVRGRQPDPADHPRRARLLRAARRPRHPGRRSTRRGSSSSGCARSPSAPSSTPSCPAPSTPSTSSRRSAPRTSCARSTATCTGTGTSTAGSATAAI